LKIDDPVGAFGVHYASGLWAMIATGLFAENIPGFDMISEDGCFKGGNGGILAWNLVACIVITLWSGGFAAIVVGVVISYTFLMLFTPTISPLGVQVRISYCV